MKNKLIHGLLIASVGFSLTACSTEPAAKQKAAEPAATAASSASAATAVNQDKPKEEAHQAPHWSYEGTTDENNWSKLDPSFASCANGTEQSPIDIELSQVKLDKSVSEIKINYKATNFTLMNNGHTIQVNDPSGANSIVVEGKEYKLVQMHFHKPSENEINGQSFDMEGHLVHKSSDGKLAVLAYLIKIGKENTELAEVWRKLPKQETKEDIKLDKAIDLVNLLPKEKKTFSYNGSLTTPPCSEGVKWTVFEQPIEMSKEQVEAFGKIFPDNHRPVQPIKNRSVITTAN